MSPALGEEGSVTLNAPPDVSVKYPTPETALPGSAVIFVVFQFTVPVLPKPD